MGFFNRQSLYCFQVIFACNFCSRTPERIQYFGRHMHAEDFPFSGLPILYIFIFTRYDLKIKMTLPDSLKPEAS